MNTVAFGGGCFWCTEAVFKMLTGVISVQPGYSGGHVSNPTYKAVCTGDTGHAEAVRITFNPDEISYRDLLTVFFATHDPTTLNRQGADIGTQYRSVIFFTTPEQERQAREMIEEINASNPEGDPVVTEVVPLELFYDAEAEHLDYYARNKEAGYCQVVINPKLAKVQKEFGVLLKANN